MINPLAAPWGMSAALRVAAYRAGWLPVHRLGRPTVSIGALEMGGTGKTPVAAGIARILRDSGLKVAILSRGYRREGTGPALVSAGTGLRVAVRQAGDEPAWYAHTIAGVIVAVGARREQAAALSAPLKPDLFLLDDAFQHVRVARDLDLLVVDAERPFYRSGPPPVGRLREWPCAARRASGFAIHGDPAGHVATVLERRYPGRPTFQFKRAFPGPVPLQSFLGGTTPSDPSALPDDVPVFAFAGIARPERLFARIDSAAKLVGQRVFADHHWYTGTDMKALDTAARTAGAQALVTTEKDAVRLAAVPRIEIPTWVWRYRLDPTDPGSLTQWLRERLQAAA